MAEASTRGPQVFVCGAGAVGLFCALALARRGARVQIATVGFSSRRDPFAASWAAAGMLGALAEIVADPATAHPDAAAMALAALPAWERAAAALKEAGAADPRRDCGALILADSVARAARFDAALALAESHGVPAARVRGADLHARAPGLAIAEAIWAPAEGVIDIAEAFAALNAALAWHGVEVVEGAEVAADAAGRVEILGRGPVAADWVVLAPGLGALAPLTPAAPALARLFPAKGQMALIDAPCPVVLRGDGVYAAPRRGRTVIGATMELHRADRAAPLETAEAMRARLARLSPAFAEAPILETWAGVRPMSPDWSPLIGPAGPPGVLLAAGHGRNGWLLAPLTGEMIADYVFGDGPDPLAAAFRPDRFDH